MRELAGNLFWISLCAFMARTAPAQTTWYVAAGNGGNGAAATPFGTIQGAIDAALSGDTILVSPGTYYENIVFGGKSVELIALQGPAMTAIDGQQSGTVVRFTGGETNAALLDGFEIKNGIGGLCCGGLPQPGGIQIQGAAPRIRRCRILNNIGQTNSWPSSLNSGAGGVEVELSTSVADFEDCEFVGNIGGNFNPAPGAIRVNAGSARFVRCTFDSNMGGGWEVFGFNGGCAGAVDIAAGNPTFERCRFIGNLGGFGGPGVATIRGSSGQALFDHCVFSQNSGGNGQPPPFLPGNPDAAGAFDLRQASPLEFRDCTIAGNESVNVGGAFHFSGATGTLVLARTILWNSQSAAEITGATISPTISDCVVRGGASGTNVLTLDPLFASYPVDLHLTSNSPCIDAAQPTGVVATVDWDGDWRPFYGAPDIGVDEFVSSAFRGTAVNFPLNHSEKLRINADPAVDTHTVEVLLNTPITVTLDTLDGTPASEYVLWAKFAVPLLADEYATAYGNLAVTPFEAIGIWPFFTAASSLAIPTTAIVTAPTPVVLAAPAGLNFPATFTLQAILVDSITAPTILGTSNALVLIVR